MPTLLYWFDSSPVLEFKTVESELFVISCRVVEFFKEDLMSAGGACVVPGIRS